MQKGLYDYDGTNITNKWHVVQHGLVLHGKDGIGGARFLYL